MPQVQDMLGNVLSIPERPQRIVSLVPSQTELLYDLGLENEVAGITKFCVHPESWFRSKARIGGTKTVHADRVAALKPDLILANKEENVKAQIEALQGIAPVWVSDVQTLGDALEMIGSIATLCHRSVQGNEIAGRIAERFRALKQKTVAGKRAAYCIWRAPWIWAGGDTFINDMLLSCGFENALADKLRYPEISLEAIAGAAPELVLLSSEPYPFKEKHIEEIKAVLPDATVLLVDGEMFSWYGSRLLKAPAYFASLLQAV